MDNRHMKDGAMEGLSKRGQNNIRLPLARHKDMTKLSIQTLTSV